MVGRRDGASFADTNPFDGSLVAEVAAGGRAEARPPSPPPRAPSRHGRHGGRRAPATVPQRRRHRRPSDGRRGGIMAVEGGASRAFAAFQVKLSAAMLRQAAIVGLYAVWRHDAQRHSRSPALVARKPLGVVAGFTPWNGAFYLAWRTFLLPMAFGNTTGHQAVGGGADLGRAVPRRNPRRRRASRPARSTSSPMRRALRRRSPTCSSRAARCAASTSPARTGRRASSARARGGDQRMVLELGGFNPMLILADADLDEAVKAVIFGAFIHQGQVCMNTRKVYVARKSTTSSLPHSPPKRPRSSGATRPIRRSSSAR